jgi:hypothetical protein
MFRLACYTFTFFVAILSPGAITHALPPMGLTQVTANSVHTKLDIIDGSAYLNVSNGVWVLGPSGTSSFLPIANATKVTRVVKASDGELYVAANRGIQRPALYQLDQFGSPVMTWEYGDVVGVDSQLRVIANLLQSDGAAMLFPGGCVNGLCGEFLSGGTYAYAIDVTSNGYILGDGGIPTTIGSSPMLWSPGGEFEGFVFGYDVAGSIRERTDGNGVNVGGDIIDPLIELGPNEFTQFPNYAIDSEDYFLKRPDGTTMDYAKAIVSHGNFAVAQSLFGALEFYGFFPGIVPGFPDRALPLFDIFPQLATIDIDSISDLASIDGRVYMTVRGSDGTFLFGAPDPSVVPEPSSLFFITAMLAGVLASRPMDRD